jgi:hypothetical protein
MARLTAERSIEHLHRSGYVVKKTPTAQANSSAGHMPDLSKAKSEISL